jgi:hypothetical protein
MSHIVVVSETMLPGADHRQLWRAKACERHDLGGAGTKAGERDADPPGAKRDG